MSSELSLHRIDSDQCAPENDEALKFRKNYEQNILKKNLNILLLFPPGYLQLVDLRVKEYS